MMKRAQGFYPTFERKDGGRTTHYCAAKKCAQGIGNIDRRRSVGIKAKPVDIGIGERLRKQPLPEL